MTSTTKSPGDFDLRPDPRILPMLGEINLDQWQALAELIDNAVDGFLISPEADITRRVIVSLPTSDVPNAQVMVRDNGPGMSPEVLERAVRAGWSGSTSPGTLGMFGMGFNIATARLGTVTTVWTATRGDAEWHGLEIDFATLARQRHYRTAHRTRPKVDSMEHGTEVTITQLKSEQRAWLSKPANRSRLRQRLSEAYSAMLRADGKPIHFDLAINGRPLLAKEHCTWSGEREVIGPRGQAVPAMIVVDRKLPARPYCTACWQWLSGPSEEVACPACGTADSVISRQRRVHGWIGLQRYLSTSSFGIDFIRNGRKIEIGNKDLFDWSDESGVEREYPIDDPRNRGRFVGEIHLDHCRVTYMKDRFERTDTAWGEMMRIVRGDGPLRPNKAAEAGFGPNESPLYRLYQGFRRSTPHKSGEIAGQWARILVVQDNDRAEEMARRFEKGEPAYQPDDEWGKLIEEVDNKLLTPVDEETSEENLSGFAAEESEDSSSAESAAEPDTEPAPPRHVIASLTRQYHYETTGQRWDVQAFRVDPADPELLPEGAPWCLRRSASGEHEFLIDTSHPVFKSATMTDLDALLSQLAWSAADFVRGQQDAPSFAVILADLRQRYAGVLELDAVEIKAQAESMIGRIARAWHKGVDADDCQTLFSDELTAFQQEGILRVMAARSVVNPNAVVLEGRFLEYAAPHVVLAFVETHPELFLDGRCWEEPYSTLSYPTEAAAEEARQRVCRHYVTLLSDAVWLAEQEPDDLAVTSRERLLRASLAVDLLAPLDQDDD